MSRRLGLIAVGGIVIGVVCIASAVGIGGRSFFDHMDFDFGPFDGPRCVTPDVDAMAGQGTRELDWTGGDRVAIDIPANIHYQRGQGDKVVVSGDKNLIGLVEIRDNDIRFNCHMHRFGRRLEITLPGRDFMRYTINGSADMALAGIDQPHLRIRVNGSGDVTASGKTDDLDYGVAGSGDGHFQDLDAGDVSVNVAGSGDADVAPHKRLDVNIAGSGKVTLHNEPQELETHIAGSGRIVHVDGSVTRQNGLKASKMRHHDDDDDDSDVPRPPAPPAPPPPPPAKGI